MASRLKIEFFTEERSFSVYCEMVRFSEDGKEIRCYNPENHDLACCSYDFVFIEPLVKFTKIIFHFRSHLFEKTSEFYTIHADIEGGILENYDGNLAFLGWREMNSQERLTEYRQDIAGD